MLKGFFMSAIYALEAAGEKIESDIMEIYRFLKTVFWTVASWFRKDIVSIGKYRAVFVKIYKKRLELNISQVDDKMLEMYTSQICKFYVTRKEYDEAVEYLNKLTK